MSKLLVLLLVLFFVLCVESKVVQADVEEDRGHTLDMIVIVFVLIPAVYLLGKESLSHMDKETQEVLGTYYALLNVFTCWYGPLTYFKANIPDIIPWLTLPTTHASKLLGDEWSLPNGVWIDAISATNAIARSGDFIRFLSRSTGRLFNRTNNTNNHNAENINEVDDDTPIDQDTTDEDSSDDNASSNSYTENDSHTNSNTHTSSDSYDPVGNAPNFDIALTQLRLQQLQDEMNYGDVLLERGSKISVEKLYRQMFHKRVGLTRVPIRKTRITPNIHTKEEFLDILTWSSKHGGHWANKTSDFYIPPQDITMLTVRIGGEVFDNVNDAISWAEGQGITSGEFVSGDGDNDNTERDVTHASETPMTKLNSWYNTTHQEFPDIEYDEVDVEGAKLLGAAGYNATGGEGVPEYIRPNIVLLDLFATRISCVFQALCFAWMFYRTDDAYYDSLPQDQQPKKRNSVFENITSYKEIKEYFARYIIPIMKRKKIPMQWSTDDGYVILQHLQGFKIRLHFEGKMYWERGIDELTLEDFSSDNKTIHLYISRTNHASMMMHKDMLTSTWIDIINTKRRFTYGHKILNHVKSKREQSLYKYIHTADIESLLVWTSSTTQIHIPYVLCANIGGSEYEWIGKDCVKNFVEDVMKIELDNLHEFTSMEGQKRKSKSLEIWFHNLNYDVSLMLMTLLDNARVELDHPAEPLTSNNRIISLTVKLNGGLTLVLRDSWKHYSMSLKTWAESMFPNNPEKWKGDFKVLQCKTPEEITSRECVDYCKRDCKTLRDLLYKVQVQSLETTGINQLTAQTITSYSAEDFYTNYYDAVKTPIYTLTKSVEKFVRGAYFGGLCMVFYAMKVTGVIMSLDINSSYGYMMTQDLPYGIYNWENEEFIKHMNKEYTSSSMWKEYMTKHPGYYKVCVTVEKGIATPWLPYKSSNGLEVPYLTRMEGTWTSLRLCEAIDRGAVIHKATQIVYVKLGPVCKSFVDSHYKTRQESKDPVVKIICKNILNTLYGFLGFSHMNRKNFTIVGKRLSRQMMNNVAMGRANGKMYNDIFIGETITDLHNENKNVGIAAWITDRAQSHLLTLREQIEEVNGYKVLYTDTDSLKVLCPDNIKSIDDLPDKIRSLIDNTRLGALKIENAQNYKEEYLKTCEELEIKPCEPKYNFIREACYRSYKEYYEIDSNNIHNVHIKSVNIKEIGYDYKNEEHTLSSHEQKVVAASLIRLTMESHGSFKLTKRKMHTSTLMTFMNIGTHNELIEVEMKGLLRKVTIGEFGWTIPLIHTGKVESSVYHGHMSGP
jgi:DNA polymerase type B, organellar and viral